VISYCFVDPDFRHQGVGSIMMNWGLKQADTKGIETFVESTEDGEKFYAAHGFDNLHDFTIDIVLPKSTKKFSELKNKFLPIHGYMMKRHVGGKNN